MISRRGIVVALVALAGAAVVCPLTARTQEPTKPVIGYLGPPLGARQHWLAAFHRGLSAEGFVEGQNATIEYRLANSSLEALQELAADLVRRRVAVIAAIGPAAALAAKRTTQTIPIVFLSGVEPVQMGLVSSFNQPGGNVTGFYVLATELVAKRLALLHELSPGAKRVAVLVNPTNAATAEPTIRDVAAVSRALGLEVRVFNASSSGEIGAAFTALSSWRAEALFLGPDPLFNTEGAQLVTLAARHALPAAYFQRDHAEAGGLMSYGHDFIHSYHQVGGYVGRILKGTTAADLPVQQPTKLELVINLKTAKALGIAIPRTILERADEVIE